MIVVWSTYLQRQNMLPHSPIVARIVTGAADAASGANGPARSFAAFNSIVSGHAAFVSVVNAPTGLAK